MEETKPTAIRVTLRGENYLLWSRSTKSNLYGRGLWNQVEPAKGKELQEGDEEAREKWLQKDQMVLSIIHSSLSDSIFESYSYCETALELWETLKKVYGDITNLSRVFEVKKDLSNLTQEDQDFTKHFGKYRSLLAELDMLRPSTKDLKIIEERKEQDRVFGLLQSLHPKFNDLIKYILREEKLPSLENVCSQIQKEQGSLDLFSKGELPTANKGFYKPPFSSNKKGTTKQCEHCKNIGKFNQGRGHTKEECFILHPHLRANFRARQQANEANASNYAPATQPTTALRMNPSAPNGHSNQASTSENNGMITMSRADLEAMIKTMQICKESGITFLASNYSKTLLVDSGASHHMIKDSDLLNNIQNTSGHVEVANGVRVPIKGVGNLNLFGNESSAFYMPTFSNNLVSVKRATTDLNAYAIFGPNSFHFQDIKTGEVLGKGNTKGELYTLEDLKNHSRCSNSASLPFINSCHVASSSNDFWHARLGHPHSRALKLIMPNVVFDNSKCESCILGKHCRSVFQNSLSIYENCFDLVHSDVWTSPCLSRDNLKYFVTFIDEKSKYTWVTLLPSKDRVFEAFVNFQTYVTNHFNAKIKVLRSDNGGEYTSHTFKAHLANHGILHQTSCPYTPQQNGVAERKNRHLMEVARSMMFHKNMPRRFWGDAVMTACYLINRIPTKVLDDLSPFEVLNKTKPNINHLRVFGSVCFVLVPRDQRNKLDAKSTRSVFIGYSTTQKGYRCYDPSTKRIMTSRDVKFLEDQSYFEKSGWESVKDLADSTTDRAASLQHILSHMGLPQMNEDQTAPANNQEDQIQEEGVNVQNEQENDEGVNEQGGVNQETPPEADTQQNEYHEEEEAPAPTLRRSTRQRFGPDHWKQTRVYYNHQVVAHPIQAQCSLALLPSDHQAFLGKIEQHYIPKTYEEAKEIKVWMDAIDAEIEAMVRNHTWDVSDLPSGKRAVTSKWVFTIKYHSNGEIERYKARMVARGFTQTYGEDYTDTFAPVAKLHTVRVILSLATNLSWELWQMDVKNAFLQGELEEEVYMKPPPGLESSIPHGKVFKLRKAIYGLKQSPRAWYHKLSFTLTAKGFKRSEADHTLFTSQSAQGIIVVLVYVDDLIISGNDQAGIQETKLFLKSVFDIKDLGELKYFLGIEICRSPEGLFLSQRKYSLDLLTETGKLGSKPAKTPLEDGYKVRRKGEKGQDPLDKPFEDPAQYRRLVGKLIYLTITRPDLCFAVNQVSQHMKEPLVHHWNMVERILRYIKGSPGQGVWMGKNNSTEVVGYCDADYAGDTMDRKSTTGYCTFIGGNLVTWKSKKQKVVSCSSAESEYRAMKKLTNELVWLKALLKDLGIESTSPITMHCDNQAAIHIATNSVFHERTKHIEVDCHKVREKIIEGVILPCYTRSEDQLADIFTKSTSLKICNHIHSKLGLIDLTHP